MKLVDAMTVESLRMHTASLRPKIVSRTLSAAGVARIAFKMAANEQRGIPSIAKDAWINEKLSSDTFTLVEARTNRIADPNPRMSAGRVARVLASIEWDKPQPIVVDYNTMSLGFVESLGFSPKAIVVDGREKFAAANIAGERTILAWVGDKVLDYVRASREIAPDVLSAKVFNRMVKEFDLQAEGSPILQTILPFENAFIFSFNKRKFRQTFRVTDNDIEFIGKPQPMWSETNIGKFTRGTIGAFIKDQRSIEACGCENGIVADGGGVGVFSKSKKMHACLDFDQNGGRGGPIPLNDLWKAYNKDGIKARAKIRAVSPPGFEDTVKHIKKEHPEIDNPWALTWWMRDKGYTPHHPPEGPTAHDKAMRKK